MSRGREFLELYAVTDRAWVGRRTLLEQIELALSGGITCLQLREKDLSCDEIVLEAIRAKKLCARRGVPLIVNDSLEAAIRSNADGLHIGQGDVSAREARDALGPSKILGVSASTVDEARRAQADGADYIGIGAIFATPTKPDADVVPLDTVREICAAVDIPAVAIGGIKSDNIETLEGLGLAGAAIVSAIFGADDITSACVELKRLTGRIVGRA